MEYGSRDWNGHRRSWYFESDQFRWVKHDAYALAFFYFGFARNTVERHERSGFYSCGNVYRDAIQWNRSQFVPAVFYFDRKPDCRILVNDRNALWYERWVWWRGLFP